MCYHVGGGSFDRFVLFENAQQQLVDEKVLCGDSSISTIPGGHVGLHRQRFVKTPHTSKRRLCRTWSEDKEIKQGPRR